MNKIDEIKSLIQTSKFDQAEKKLKIYLKKDPRNGILFIFISSIYKRQKSYSKVINVLTDGINNNAFSSKQLVTVHFLMGVSYFHLDNKTRSIKHFCENSETAIKCKPFFLALLRKSINQLDFEMIDLLGISFGKYNNQYKLLTEVSSSILRQKKKYIFRQIFKLN